MPRYPHFVDGSYRAQSRIASQEMTMNFFPERNPNAGAKAEWVLYPVPGSEVYSPSGPEAPGRQLEQFNGRGFAVIGPTLYEALAGGARIARGTVAVNGNPATMSYNGDGGGQLFITSGDVGYCYDLATNVLTMVLASGATVGTFLGGYFIALDAATSTFRLSDLFDGLTWDPLQFAQRTLAGDPWRSASASLTALWLLGQETSEVWFNAGTFPFPFAPHTSALINYGIAAGFGPARVGNDLAWLARTKNDEGQVVLTRGFETVVISTPALEFVFSEYPRLDDAIGWSYGDQGHTFYILEFPSAGATWAYDTTTNKWHERGTWIVEENRYVAWRPRHHAYIFGEHLTLDRETGDILRIASDLYLDVEERPLRRVRRAPVLANEFIRTFIKLFELDVETGLGTPSGQGVDPMVELRVSKDGGKTFRSLGLRPVGRQGQYLEVVKWTRVMSAYKGAVFEVVFTDPIPWRVIDAYLNGRAGKAA